MTKALKVFAVLLVAMTAAFAGGARAASVSSVMPVFGDVPGLAALPVGNVTKTGTTVSGQVTLRGKPVTVIAFNAGGVNLGAVVPATFALTDVMPLPNGTPIDGVRFADVAFVYLPTGTRTLPLNTVGLPDAVKRAVSHWGSQMVLKAGLTLYGQADFASSAPVRDVLSAVGLNGYALPVNAVFPKTLFQADPRTAAANIKDQMLAGLNLTLGLPKLRVPGLPAAMAIKDAVFKVVAPKPAGQTTREVFAGVDGTVEATVAGKAVDFGFNILAQKPGTGGGKVTLTGSSKSTIAIPSFRPLTLTGLNLTAVRDGGKWTASVAAKSKLGTKDVDVTATLPASGDSRVFVQTRMTVADAFGGRLDFPGLDALQVGTFLVQSDRFALSMQLRKTEVWVSLFKVQGQSRPYVMISANGVSPAAFIPGAEATPLKDTGFPVLAFLYSPAPGTVKVSQANLPPFAVNYLRFGGTDAEVRPGLNIYASLEIHPTGELAALLKGMGITEAKLPLNGGLSPKALEGSLTATQVKNEILDHLDLSLPLPKLNLPNLSKVVNVQNTVLAIKGRNDNGTRSLDVAVGGELDVSVTGSQLVLDYRAEMHKQQGQPDSIALSAVQRAGQTVTVKLVESLALKDLDFELTKSGTDYNWTLKGQTTFRNKAIAATYIHDPNVDRRRLTFNPGGLTFKDLAGPVGLPGFDEVSLAWMTIWRDRFSIAAKVRNTPVWAEIAKVAGQSKPHVMVYTQQDKVSPADFIPGAETTPLKDVDFEHLAFVYSPFTQTVKLSDAQIPDALKFGARFGGSDSLMRPGLNIYGILSVHPSGEMANLLKTVGVTGVSYPLNGGFSPQAFATNLASVKDQILDNLDLTVPLPKMNVPGISKVVTIQDTAITLKGANSNGVRSLDVAIAGELDVSVAGTKLALDYVAEVKTQQGQPEALSLSARQPEGKPLTIKLIEPFTVSDLDFELSKADNDYAWTLSGNATFRNKAVSVIYRESPAPYLWVGTNMVLKDVIGATTGVAEIDDLAFKGFGVGRDRFSSSVAVRGKQYWCYVVKRPGETRPYFMVEPKDKVALNELIPGTDNTPLKDVDFGKVTLLYSPAQTAKTIGQTFAPDEPWLRYRDQNAVIKPGLNIYGDLSVHPGGEMAALLKDLGVTELTLPLNGGFSPRAFAQNVNATEIKNAILDSLDLQLDIPTPRIPAMAQYLTFHNGHLAVTGKLPDGQRGVAFQVSGDTDLRIANQAIAFKVQVDAARAQGGGETDLQVQGQTDKSWVHPLGITFLTLEELGLDIRKQKVGTELIYDVSMTGKSDIGPHSKLAVDIDVREDKGQLTDVFFELDGPLKLSDIPEVNRVPHAEQFALTKLIVSEHGIEADTVLGGRATDLFAFHGSGWTVALTQKDFAVTELVPPLKKTPLNEIKFPFLALMVSESGLDTQYSRLSKVGQDALKDIFSSPNDVVKIDKGLAIIAGFHPDSAGALKDGVKGIGVHDGVVVLGEIDGVFGGQPMVKLEGKLSQTGKPHNMPNGTTYKTGVEVDFFLNVLESGQDFDFELGILVGVNARIKNDILLFDSRVKMAIMDEGFGIDVEGQMQGTWHDPFGIHGFSLSDVTIEMGTQEDGSIKLGLAGATDIADEKFKMAADGKFLPEALGFPEAIAFVGTADTFPMLFVQDIALKVLAKEVKFDLPPAVLPEFKDVKFAFATPGAEDPDLHIDGEGFAMKGGLVWIGHEFGVVDMAINPTKGVYVADKIDDFDLGPLRLRDNHFNMKAGITNIVPTVSVNSDIEIRYLGLHERYDVAFDKKGASFEASANFGQDFAMHNKFQLSGIDLSLTKPNFSGADFYMEGDLKLDFGKFVEGPAKNVLDAVFNDLHAGFVQAEKDVKAARDQVNDLTGQINAERAKVRKERAAVEHRVQAAEDRVDSIKGRIDRDWGHYHGCSGWFSWACKARWGVEIGVLKAAWAVAEVALKAVESLVAHFPVDLDPRVAPLLAARDIAKGVLAAALDALDGVDFFDKVLKEVTDKVTGLIGQSVNINKAEFEGDFRGLINGTQPLAVTVDAEVFGARLEQVVPFNPSNLAYNVEQMGFLGLRALDHIVNEVLKDIPGPIRSKLVSQISSHIGVQHDAAKKELAKYGAVFAKYEQEEVELQKVIAARDKAYLQERYAEAHNPLDVDESETFTNDFIEVGHTSLCLDNVNGIIKQDRCNESGSTRWSTKPADGADNVPAGAGYYYVTEASTGHCIVPEGKWVEVQQKFTDASLSADQTFTYSVNTFEGDGKIVVTTCQNKREFYWKVLRHGEGWMQMVNRATNKCLHFKDPSSLPGDANAVWDTCVGSANQVYRVSSTTTPEYYGSKIALKNDSESACFSDPGPDGKITMVDCTKGARYNYIIDVQGYIKFINAKTGQCIQPDDYNDGAHLIERPCTQLDYQWWNPVAVPGGWRIQNAQTKTCTRAPGLGQVAVTETCRDWAESIIVPVVDPYSGITYTTDGAGYLTPVIVRAHTTEVGSDAGICSAQVASAGDTRVVGTVRPDGKCYFVYDGKAQSVPAGGANKTVTVLDGTIWQAYRFGDDLPEFAIPGGVIDKGSDSKTAYICRVRINYNQTEFGWVADLDPNKHNLCNYQSMASSEDDQGYHRPAQEFEVLVRSAQKAYLLHLGDLKPGGADAGKDPVLAASAKQKDLYSDEPGTARPTVASAAGQHGTPMSGWQGDTGDYGPPTISVVGDLVSLSGRIFGGGSTYNGIWKLPQIAAPPQQLAFYVDSSSDDPTRVEIGTDGTMMAHMVGRIGTGHDLWIDFSNITYSTESKALPTGQGWNTIYPFAAPNVAMVNGRVVLGGAVARPNDNSIYDSTNNLTQLPEGMRPPTLMRFKVASKVPDEEVASADVLVHPDGLVELDGNRFSTFVTLSGISFDRNGPNMAELAGKYGPLLNSWRPDFEHTTDGGYRLSLAGDVVTLEGAITGGSTLNGIWRLPASLAPPAKLVFSAPLTSGPPLQFEIGPDGLISGVSDGNVPWIKFTGVAFSRRAGTELGLESGASVSDGFAKPNMFKQGNRVILGGFARVEQSDPFGGSSQGQLIARLPAGAWPATNLSFTVAADVTSKYRGSATVNVRTDGTVLAQVGQSTTISLSGVAFDAK